MLHYAKQLTSKAFIKSLREFEGSRKQAKREVAKRIEDIRIKELMEECDSLPYISQRFGSFDD